MHLESEWEYLRNLQEQISEHKCDTCYNTDYGVFECNEIWLLKDKLNTQLLRVVNKQYEALNPKKHKNG